MGKESYVSTCNFEVGVHDRFQFRERVGGKISDSVMFFPRISMKVYQNK